MLRFAVNLIRTIVGFAVIAVATLIAGNLAWLAGKLNRVHVADLMAATWARVVLFVAGVSYEIRGRDKPTPGESYVVVSNHTGNLDPMMHFLALDGFSLRFMAKKEVYRIPVIGWAIKAMGMVRVDRSAPGFDYINRQVDEIFRRGWSLMVYPEGTRSRTPAMKPFKKGAFLLAVRHQRPVLPVALVGTADAWTPDDWMLKGGHVELVILDPVPTTGLGEDDVEALRAKVESIVSGAYEALKSAHLQS